jgi:hypothetical protein
MDDNYVTIKARRTSIWPVVAIIFLYDVDCSHKLLNINKKEA